MSIQDKMKTLLSIRENCNWITAKSFEFAQYNDKQPLTAMKISVESLKIDLENLTKCISGE
jgi:hypothetical protein